MKLQNVLLAVIAIALVTGLSLNINDRYHFLPEAKRAETIEIAKIVDRAHLISDETGTEYFVIQTSHGLLTEPMKGNSSGYESYAMVTFGPDNKVEDISPYFAGDIHHP